MLSTSLTAFANSYNFTIKPDFAFGVIENYLVTVYNSGSKKNAFISCCFPSNEECRENEKLISAFEFQTEMGKLIDSDYPELKNYEITTDSVSFSTSADLKIFDQSINELIKLLARYEIPGIDTCVECGKGNGEFAKYVLNDNKAHLLCESCSDEYIEKLNLQNSTKTQTKRARGSIFSALGGFIGLVLAMILFVVFIPYKGILGFNSLIATVPMAAVITVLCFLFYRSFTGKKGLERIVPCMIISALFTTVSVYICTMILYAKTMGVASISSLKTVFSIIIGAPLTDPFFKSDFLTHLFYSYVIVVIVVLIYSIIFEEKKKSVLEVIDCTTMESYDSKANTNNNTTEL